MKNICYVLLPATTSFENAIREEYMLCVTSSFIVVVYGYVKYYTCYIYVIYHFRTEVTLLCNNKRKSVGFGVAICLVVL